MPQLVDDMHVDFRIDGDATAKSQRGTVFVKVGWKIHPQTGALSRVLAAELQNDFRNEDQTPRLPPHSDYFPWKRHTDIGVVGEAYSPTGKLVESMDVMVNLGKRQKHLKVFGQRYVEFSGSVPSVGGSEPFDTVALSIENAYGGGDFRVPHDAENKEEGNMILAQADHPGLYPRNPWGTGYLVLPDPIEGMPLPTQEDADDLLTNDRLLAQDPRQWFKQPLPVHLDWVPVNNFPRCVFFAPEAEPWFEAPDDERLPEVRKRILASGYRKHLQDYLDGGGPHWRFFQEAPHDQIFSRDVHGMPVEIIGMHPEFTTLKFDLPDNPPRITLGCESTVSNELPLLTAVEIQPAKLTLSMVYTLTIDLPRPLLPGIHKSIPLKATVNGQSVAYEAPPTLKKLLEKAKANQQAKEQETTP